MREVFEKFDNFVLDGISKFNNSEDDILTLLGAGGCGKSELVMRSLEDLDENFLTFYHNCFEFGTIDDFLLNFYDSFRNYSMSKNITLKKALTDRFSSKIINYFKETNYNFLIIVDNFELIIQKQEITDFLLLIAGFQNVKLIFISNTQYALPPNFSHLKLRELEIKATNLDDFAEKIRYSLPFTSDGDIETFFTAARGSELFLRLAMNYIKKSNVNFADFIKEFKRKRVDFENFLINKIIFNIPENYHKIIKTFNLLQHCSTIEFLKEYSIATTEEVEYLCKNMMLTKTTQGVYLKGYLRNFFFNISDSEKVIFYKNLIEIYENELTKSPKDRLLRLSRESIRNLIENCHNETPRISQEFGLHNKFSYVAQTQSNFANWGSQKKEPAKESTPSKNFTQEPKAPPPQEQKAFSALDYFEDAQNFEDTYNFHKAIEYLRFAQRLNTDESLNEKILSKLAQNYIKTNNFDLAIETQLKHYEILKKTDMKKANASLYAIGLIYKKLFNYPLAVEYFNKVLNDTKNVTHFVRVKTLLSYGEINEAENKTQAAFEKYSEVVETLENNINENDKSMPSLCEAYYKIAQIYDIEQKTKDAKSFYKKNIKTCKNSRANIHLGLSYLNLADIYFDENKVQNALLNYEKAISILEENKSYEELYFIYKKLANNFEYSDRDLMFDYLNRAYNAALNLEDNFKLAFCLVEIGDYYYNKRQDEDALFSYLRAQGYSDEGVGEDNIKKINSRIEDMRVKMGEFAFDSALVQFEASEQFGQNE